MRRRAPVAASGAVRSTPVRRLLISFVTGLSLFLFVAGCALWARSYFVQDVLVFALPDGRTTSAVHSTAGSIVLLRRDGLAFPTSANHFTEDAHAWAEGPGGLVTFIYDRNPSDPGLSAIVFPHWVAAVPFAMIPAARLVLRAVRRRRSAGRGFPVNSAEQTA